MSVKIKEMLYQLPITTFFPERRRNYHPFPIPTIIQYIDRDTIAVMNTLHAFQYGFVSDMYKEAIETGVINMVEPHTTTLMYAMGKKIYFSLDSQMNIKITRKENFELFEGFVLMKRKRGEWK